MLGPVVDVACKTEVVPDGVDWVVSVDEPVLDPEVVEAVTELMPLPCVVDRDDDVVVVPVLAPLVVVIADGGTIITV